MKIKLSTKQYLMVSANRLEESTLLANNGHFSFAIYTLGVAVESVLGALIVCNNPTYIFTSAHNIQQLLLVSELYKSENDDIQKKLVSAANTLTKWWDNLLRYQLDEVIANHYHSVLSENERKIYKNCNYLILETVYKKLEIKAKYICQRGEILCQKRKII